MRRVALCMLLVLSLFVIPAIPFNHDVVSEIETSRPEPTRDIDFYSLTETFGNGIPVSDMLPLVITPPL